MLAGKILSHSITFSNAHVLKALRSYRFCDLGKIHSVPTTLRIFARSGMRHINKVRSISHAERKRERMKSARDARSDGGTRCRHFLSTVPLRVPLVHAVRADKKISGIVVLFQPDVNARTKSA